MLDGLAECGARQAAQIVHCAAAPLGGLLGVDEALSHDLLNVVDAEGLAIG
jgi:hypothetical protein